MNNYFEQPGISNSLLNKVATFEKHTISSLFWNDKTKKIEGDAIDIGINVDELLSEELKSNQIAYVDDLLNDFTSKEKEFIEKCLTISPFDAYVNTYDNKETREAKKESNLNVDLYNVVSNKADELFNKAKPYYEAIELYRDKRILSKEVYDTVFNCYNSLISNRQYLDLFEIGINNFTDEVEVFKQLEIYWNYGDDNLACKSKLDVVKVNWTNKEIIIADLKTHSQNLIPTIRKKNYIRQLSFYTEAVKEWLKQKEFDINEFTFSYYIIGVHTKYYSITIREIEEFDIIRAKEGGYYKPELFTLGKNYYMNGSQVAMLKYNEFWEEEYMNEFWIYGWKELIEIYKDKYL